MFEDVGFEHNSFDRPSTTEADMGEEVSSILQPRILKHHIPEHPRLGDYRGKRGKWTLEAQPNIIVIIIIVIQIMIMIQIMIVIVIMIS